MPDAGRNSPTPEAMGRILTEIRDRLGADGIDCLWIFPPLVRGRKEWGLVVVSLRGEDPNQRSLLTARYTAELQGTGVHFESEMTSEGVAPSDLLPRVMDGVVRRSGLRLGDPRVVRIDGDRAEFSAALDEYMSESSDGDPRGGTHG